MHTFAIAILYDRPLNIWREKIILKLFKFTSKWWKWSPLHFISFDWVHHSVWIVCESVKSVSIVLCGFDVSFNFPLNQSYKFHFYRYTSVVSVLSSLTNRKRVERNILPTTLKSTINTCALAVRFSHCLRLIFHQMHYFLVVPYFLFVLQYYRRSKSILKLMKMERNIISKQTEIFFFFSKWQRMWEWK